MATKVGSLVIDMRANTSNFSRGVGRARKEANGLKKTLGGLRTGLLALGGAFAFKQLVNQINTYTQLSNQLKLVTKDAEDLARVQKVLFDAAQETRGGLEGTVKLYARLARSTKSLKLTQSDLVTLTKTINKTLVISGASTQEASAAILQLGQGFASGVLRGQELNSVMEQTPRLARAMADGLGVGIGQLREMGKQGKLTTDVVVKALQTQSQAISTEFNKTEKTIAQAMTQIENEFLKTFGSAQGGGLVKSLDEFRAIISDPDVAEGLTAIAQGIINVGSAVAGTIGLLSKFGTFIGKTLAGGASKTLDEQISIAERRLGRATRELGRADRSLRSDDKKKEVEENFQAKLKELQFLQGLKKGNEDAALAAENLTAKLKERQTVFSGPAFGNDKFTESLKSFSDRLNEERALEKQHLEDRKAMVTKYTEERIAFAEEEAARKKHLLNDSLSVASNIAGSLSSLARSEGGKETKRSRELAKISIGISTAQAIMNALATPPYPLGLALAAGAALTGAQQLSRIGAGGGNSFSTPTQSSVTTLPSVADATDVQPTKTTQIIFTGDNYEGTVFSERIIEIISDATNDRDIVVFNGDSRQAQEIRDQI